MGSTMKVIHLRVDDELYENITNIANKKGDSIAEVTRTLIRKGLEKEITEDNSDYVAELVRQQMEVVIKPHIERLAALSSKGGYMAATATFLNVQAFMDLVPTEKRKDVRDLYDKARKKAVVYMKNKAEDFEQD